MGVVRHIDYYNVLNMTVSDAAASFADFKAMGGAAEHVDLMPKDQDLDFKPRSRAEVRQEH